LAQGVILIDVRFDTLKSPSSCVLQPQCVRGARWLRLGSRAEGFDKLNRAHRATLTSIKITSLGLARLERRRLHSPRPLSFL